MEAIREHRDELSKSRINNICIVQPSSRIYEWNSTQSLTNWIGFDKEYGSRKQISTDFSVTKIYADELSSRSIWFILMVHCCPRTFFRD